ncbi:MAG: hypothetical protein RIS36_896, partial [Pseudomonadota bacterium]
MAIRPAHITLTTRMTSLVVGILWIVALAYPPMPVITLIGDSDQYRQAARELLLEPPLSTQHVVSPTPHIATPLRPP